jgi:hypothetical protein
MEAYQLEDGLAIGPEGSGTSFEQDSCFITVLVVHVHAFAKDPSP